MWVPRLNDKMAVPPRIRETRIQLTPKFYYSSRKAHDKENAVSALHSTPLPSAHALLTLITVSCTLICSGRMLAGIRIPGKSRQQEARATAKGC